MQQGGVVVLTTRACIGDVRSECLAALCVALIMLSGLYCTDSRHALGQSTPVDAAGLLQHYMQLAGHHTARAQAQDYESCLMRPQNALWQLHGQYRLYWQSCFS